MAQGRASSFVVPVRLTRLVATFGRPVNLAIFRVTVLAALLLAPDLYDAPRWAALPEGLRLAPPGLFGALARLPITPDSARLAMIVAVLAGALALLGLFTRAALITTALATLYLLTIPQLYGPVTHNHHLFWFLALLAASPCADALSLDALRRPEPRPRAAAAYAIPLLFAWALVAAIFFFPGMWKLRASGLEWITSDNLRHQLHWKWAQTGNFTPSIRIDKSPFLCQLAALGVVAFELCFAFLLPSSRLRPAAVACAWLFHLATAIWMRVAFFSLALCYLVFFDWHPAVLVLRERLSRLNLPPWLVRAPQRRARSGADRRLCSTRTLPAIVVGSLLLGACIVQGARGAVNDWPFACYPTFQELAGPEMPALEVFAVRADGAMVALPSAVVTTDQTQRTWALAWSLLRKDVPAARYESYLRALEREESVRALTAGAEKVRFYRAWLAVAPEDRGKAPVRRELLRELRPASKK